MASDAQDIEVTVTQLPKRLAERVAIDLKNRVVYADSRSAGDPELLSWRQRNATAGAMFSIKVVGVDEISKARTSGLRQTEDADEELLVRADAIKLIEDAAAYRASDLHLMMRGTHTDIQITVKGGLRLLDQRTHNEGLAIARAIYQGIATVRDGSYNLLEFQSGQIPGDALPLGTDVTSIRIIRGPSYPQSQDGSFMTLRLQYASGKGGHTETELRPLPLPRAPEGSFQLENMGYTQSNIEKLKLLMDAPNGINIFTGPTGSGKTSSMFEALMEIARKKPQRRLVTAEDPVEYPMDHAVQMAITNTRNDAENGAAYGERIRVALRMAPHIILLSELRGPDVAVAALEAAVTGHQVWTTMHVTDPFLFVERLELMDRQRLARQIFCDHKVVRGVVAQRLLPKICSHCSRPLHEHAGAIPDRMIKALSTWGDVSNIRIQGDGCPSCNYDGQSGRFAVCEVVVMDAKVMNDFMQHGSDYAREQYRARPDADPSLLEASIKYALQGVIDPRAVEDFVDLIEPRVQTSAEVGI